MYIYIYASALIHLDTGTPINKDKIITKVYKNKCRVCVYPHASTRYISCLPVQVILAKAFKRHGIDDFYMAKHWQNPWKFTR